MATHALTHPATARASFALIGFVLLCEAVGLSGALFTDATWYRELARPSWAPPGWLFGPVWIALYATMGVAAWMVWRTGPGVARQRAMIWFGAQLALNAALLFGPYLAWVTFAAALNARIWSLA